MVNIYPSIRAAGGEVLVVSFTPPEKVKVYLNKYPQPFAVASDPQMKAYRAFALGRAGIGSFFRPRVLWRFLKLISRGWRPRMPGAGQDVLQLGGDFVLDAQQRLVLSHPSKNAADRPGPEELLAALVGPACRAGPVASD